MATHHHLQRMDNEDQEMTLIYNTYPCAYYVQSPSTVSHATLLTNVELSSTIFNSSPSRSDILLNNKINDQDQTASRLTLSRYSSSHGSNTSNHFLMNNDHHHHGIIKKMVDHDHDLVTNGGGSAEIIKGVNRLIIVDHHGKEDEDEDEEEEGDDLYYGRRGGWWLRYFSVTKDSSCSWVCLQMSWRLVLSLVVALLVFYIATKPPPPNISIKMAGIPQFGLGEGVDRSGVATKILSCNCSMNLLIENKSKLFGLHIHPPLVEMSFDRLSLATSQGSKLYAANHGSSMFALNVGVKNKPMYGAGRNMEDLLESGNGLPIVIRVRLSSNFRVVWNIIKPKFRHQTHCLVVLGSDYDKKHQTQAYNSTCTVSFGKIMPLKEK